MAKTFRPRSKSQYKTGIKGIVRLQESVTALLLTFKWGTSIRLAEQESPCSEVFGALSAEA